MKTGRQDQICVEFPQSKAPRLLTLGKCDVALEELSLDYALWKCDVEDFLKALPTKPLFDLIITSPPYNLGKEYEVRVGLQKYLDWQEGVITDQSAA